MRKLISAVLNVVLLQSLFCCAFFPVNLSAQTKETINNQTVIEMQKNGLSEEVIIAKIKSSETAFDTSAIALQTLRANGVSNAVIMLMMQPKEPKSPAEVMATNSVAASNVAVPFVLDDKTPVRLKLSRKMSSADAKTGETVDFEVIEDVKIGDVIVIQKGAVAIGTVLFAKKRGRLGKGGKLDMGLNSVKLVSGDKAPLRANKDAQGGSRVGAMTGAMVATGILFFPAAPLFLLLKGKDITIPEGTEVTGYIDGAMPLDITKFAAPAK